MPKVLLLIVAIGSGGSGGSGGASGCLRAPVPAPGHWLWQLHLHTHIQINYVCYLCIGSWQMVAPTATVRWPFPELVAM